jgi:hypothetical protein
MPYAYGNNSQSTISLFNNRKFYDTDVLRYNSIEPSYIANRTFIDTFVEKPFYGRIDDKSFSVVSGRNIILNSNSPIDELNFKDSEYIKKFRGVDVFAMNFVVDAFNEMADFYNTTCQLLPQLVQEDVLLTIAPRKGWTSPVEAYKQYMDKVFKLYLQDYYSYDETVEVTNFDTFMQSFVRFLKNNRDSFSILFSSFMVSRGISILSSGLAIDILDEDYGDDYVKTSKYLGSKTYVHLIETVRRYGFFIDRTVPWRLIANLSSTAMIAYMDPYGFNSLEDMFKTQFVRSSKYDLFLLRDTMINAYKYLVQYEPKFIKNEQDLCGLNLQELDRDNRTKKEYYEKYPLEKWLDLYVSLRALAVRSDFNNSVLKKVQTQTKQIFITSGLDMAVNNIDSLFNTYGDLLLKKEYFTTKFEDVTTLPQQEPRSTRDIFK